MSVFFKEIDEKRNNIEIYNMLHDIKHGKKELTKENALFVLTGTNYYKFIRQLLDEILKLDDKKQEEFYHVVLGMLVNRDQPKDIIDDCRAWANKYNDAFGVERLSEPIPGVGYLSSPMIRKFYNVFGVEKDLDYSIYSEIRENFYCKELNFIRAEGLSGNIHLNKSNNVFFTNMDLGNVEELKLDYLTKDENLIEKKDNVSFKNCKMPKNISIYSKLLRIEECDFENTEKIEFLGIDSMTIIKSENLPKVLDLSMCDNVNLYGCDLSGVEKITFKEGAIVNLEMVKNLPKNLDLSMCDSVRLGGTDLKGIEKLAFRKDARVSFSQIEFDKFGGLNITPAYNLPMNLDVSKCSIVDFTGNYELNNFDKISFAEGSTVIFNHMKSFPKSIDVSKCKKVEICRCTNIPYEEMDFSCCEEASLAGSELSNVKNILGPKNGQLDLSEAIINADEFDLSKSKSTIINGTKIKANTLILGGIANVMDTVMSNVGKLVLTEKCEGRFSGGLLPAIIDASKAKDLTFNDCSTFKLKELYLRNEVQKNKIIIPDDLVGRDILKKVKYTNNGFFNNLCEMCR